MSDQFASADAHAYVDNSLGPTEKRAFETRLRDDPDLRRRVDLWLAQNEAIRLAYGAPPRARGPLTLARAANENPPPRAPLDIATRRASQAPGPARKPVGRESGKIGRVEPARAPSPRPGRNVAVGCLALAMLLGLSAFGGPLDPRDPLIEAGAAAYRAFGGASSAPLDFATDDPRALARWLAPRFLRAPFTGELNIPGFRLIGARMVSGVASAAAFVLYENASGERSGLLIEPLDAPPDWPPGARQIGPIVVASETQGGTGVVAVGPTIGFVAAVMRVWSRAVPGGA